MLYSSFSSYFANCTFPSNIFLFPLLVPRVGCPQSGCSGGGSNPQHWNKSSSSIAIRPRSTQNRLSVGASRSSILYSPQFSLRLTDAPFSCPPLFAAAIFSQKGGSTASSAACGSERGGGNVCIRRLLNEGNGRPLVEPVGRSYCQPPVHNGQSAQSTHTLLDFSVPFSFRFCLQFSRPPSNLERRTAWTLLTTNQPNDRPFPPISMTMDQRQPCVRVPSSTSRSDRPVVGWHELTRGPAQWSVVAQWTAVLGPTGRGRACPLCPPSISLANGQSLLPAFAVHRHLPFSPPFPSFSCFSSSHPSHSPS